MKYDPQKHHRRSIRLANYNYSQAGAYFVTLVTHGRINLFGQIDQGEMRLAHYGEIVRAFKSFSAIRINHLRNMAGTPVWQRNYFERVVRDDQELNLIRRYIQENPGQWIMDRENSEHLE